MEDLEKNEIETENEEKSSSKKLGMLGMFNALSAARMSGDISKTDFISMKQNMGISQAYFTRKQRTRAQIKQHRKLQKLARRAQRNKK